MPRTIRGVRKEETARPTAASSATSNAGREVAGATPIPCTSRRPGQCSRGAARAERAGKRNRVSDFVMQRANESNVSCAASEQVPAGACNPAISCLETRDVEDSNDPGNHHLWPADRGSAEQGRDHLSLVRTVCPGRAKLRLQHLRSVPCSDQWQRRVLHREFDVSAESRGCLLTLQTPPIIRRKMCAKRGPQAITCITALLRCWRLRWRLHHRTT